MSAALPRIADPRAIPVAEVDDHLPAVHEDVLKPEAYPTHSDTSRHRDLYALTNPPHTHHYIDVHPQPDPSSFGRRWRQNRLSPWLRR